MEADAGPHEGQPHPRRSLPLRRAGLVPTVLRLPGNDSRTEEAARLSSRGKERGSQQLVSLHFFQLGVQ